MKLSDVIIRDTTANQPAANAVAVGTLFYDTTLSTMYRSNGSSWESVEGTGGVSDHGALSGLADDDHSAYPLITNFESDRATIATNWTDLTDGGETTLHSHAAATEAIDVGNLEASLSTNPWEYPGVGEGHIQITIDGAGSAISTGVAGDLYIPFDITLTGHTLIADQSGSIVLDLWVDTIANHPPTVADTITASDKPTLSTAISTQDNNISTWTTNVNGGSVMRVNVDSITTVTRVQLTLGYQRRGNW